MRTLIGITLTAMLLWFSCANPDRIADGGMGDETTNGIVMGYLRTADSMPVADAQVVLFALPNGTKLVANAVDTTASGADGFYALHAPQPGGYQFVARSRDTSLVTVGAELNIEQPEDTVREDAVLQAGSSIEGVAAVALDGSMRATVSLRKTPLAISLEADGRFAFATVPPGDYELWCTVADTTRGFCLAAWDSVILPEQSSALTVDTLRIPRLGDSGDTLILDNFDDGVLDNNPLAEWSTVRTPDTYTHEATVDSFGLHSGDTSENGSIHLDFTLDSLNRKAWLSIKARFTPRDSEERPQTVIDGSNIQSITFRARGSGHKLAAVIHTDFSPWTFKVFQIDSLPGQWTHYRVDIDSVEQAMDPWVRTDWELQRSYIITLQFPVTWPRHAVPARGEVGLDDIRLTFR